MDQATTEASATELAREIIDDTRELVRLELALAKREGLAELARARSATIALGIGLVAANVGLVMVFVTIVVAARASALVAAGLSLGFFAAAAVAAAIAWRRFPRPLLGGARTRIEEDVRIFKERGAWSLSTTHP